MDVKLPNLGEGADSGSVVNILVKEGDIIQKDQPLIELENEKAVATISSTAAGPVTKIHVKVGDKISVGAKILSVGDGGAAPAAAPANAAPTAKPAPASAPKEAAAAPAATPATDEFPDAAPGEEKDVTAANATAAAAPSLRKMANELGIDLSLIRGSGRGGRVVVDDARGYVQRMMHAARQSKAVAPAAGTPVKPAAEKIDFSQWGSVLKKPMSSLRKVISRRMLENWNGIPHVTQFDDADMTTIVELQKKYQPAYESKGARLTLTPFILKAVVAALKKHPLFNSSLDEASEEIVIKEYYHIGIAVDTEQGLIVPVIRDVDRKSVLELSGEIAQLAKKARDRKVTPDELKGGSFTISNQGAIGGAHFTPIVNKPQAAILGLGKSALKAVVRGGTIVPRNMTPIGISYDHRIIDGGEAARFTVDLVQAFENFNEADVKI